MNWRTSATGKTVATASDGRRFEISRLICFVGRKAVYRWRMRVDGMQVGGPERVTQFRSIAHAKKYAEAQLT